MPGDGDLRLRDRGVDRAAVRHELGEAEVEHLDQAALGAHQVGALDVAMDDAAARAPRPARRRPAGRLRRSRGSAARPCATRGESSSPSTYSMTMKSAPLVLADVVGDGDVRRAQHRRGARLGQQPRAALGIGLERVRQELQRDLTSEPDVFGAIHLAHAAGAEAPIDPVVLHGPADRRLLTLLSTTNPRRRDCIVRLDSKPDPGEVPASRIVPLRSDH